MTVKQVDAAMDAIDEYAKDGGPGVFLLLCTFYREPSRSLIVK